MPLPARFAVIVFTYRKIGGKLPVTKGKTGNYCLPIGKLSLLTEIFGGKGKLEKVNLQYFFYYLVSAFVGKV